MIIPADEEAGGAVEALVPRYLDTLCLYADSNTKDFWRRSLAELGRTGDREQLITRLVEKERDAQTELERFFVRFKIVTIDAYFQSDIGKAYLGYKGNGHSLTFPGCKDHLVNA